LNFNVDRRCEGIALSDGKRYWFPAKRIGWGWGPPSTWEGWVVLLAFFVSLGMSARRLLPEDPGKFAWVAVLTSGVLIAICFVKGEPPGGRGGD
jgi:hypothetical protein